jgi:hypothetical protein
MEIMDQAAKRPVVILDVILRFGIENTPSTVGTLALEACKLHLA